MNTRNKQPTKDDIDRILAFLPIFERADFKAAQWIFYGELEDGSIPMPYCDYSPAVIEFVTVLEETGFLICFDWCSWEQSSELDDIERIKTADIETLRKLLTYYVRCDRYCEGHLAVVFETGCIKAILNRLKALATDL